MRQLLVLLAACTAFAACGSGSANDAPGPTSEQETTVSEAPAEPATTEAELPAHAAPERDLAMEAHLRRTLPSGMGAYYSEIASIAATTEKITIRTKTSDPDFLYRGTCQTALDFASEQGATNVEVLDSSGVVKSASNGSSQCDKRY